MSMITNLIEAKASVVMFLANGVKLEGRLIAYQTAPISGFILERDKKQQFVFEKNISTIAPTA